MKVKGRAQATASKLALEPGGASAVSGDFTPGNKHKTTQRAPVSLHAKPPVSHTHRVWLLAQDFSDRVLLLLGGGAREQRACWSGRAKLGVQAVAVVTWLPLLGGADASTATTVTTLRFTFAFV